MKTAVVCALLCSDTCERRIKHSLEHPYSERFEKFDPFFTSKSEYATRKIVDVIKSRLNREKINAKITCEARQELGTYDVLIENINPSGVIHDGQHAMVKLEVKSGSAIDFGQVERYLIEQPGVLILIRVLARQVIRLDPSELREFTNFAIKEEVQKARRLLEGTYHTVPGKYCGACMDFSCEHNRFTPPKKVRMVQLSDANAQEDIALFFRNLPYVADKTANLVIKELMRDTVKESKEEELG